MRPICLTAWAALVAVCGCSAAGSTSVAHAPAAPAVVVAPAVATEPEAAVEHAVEKPEPTLAAPEGAKTMVVTREQREGDEAPAQPARIERPSGPRMASVGELSMIYAQPRREGLALGYIRMGTSVALRSDKPVGQEGCAGGWYPVEPRGYACREGSTTLNLDDPYFRALESVAPRAHEVWPYRYAFSNGAPMYSRVPTEAEAAKAELAFGPRRSFVQLAKWSAGHEELISDEPIVASDPVPEIFAGGRRHVGGGFRSTASLLWRVIPNGSMLAYARAFEAGGRVWLVTPDLMLVPADRVRAFRRSTFHGVDLGHGVELPLAWNRAHEPRPRYRRDEGGGMVEVDRAFAPRAWAQVKAERVVVAGRTFLALRGDEGLFVEDVKLTVTSARTKLPNTVAPGQRWLDARIMAGTLTAYEGLTPVRATLFSPGKGGAPAEGFDPFVYSMTRTGIFPIEWKDRIATMSPDKGAPTVLWFADVPHIQYLRAPLAMHASYWHEDFGNLKSAECLNVSPTDAQWLFDWTEPTVPEGWGGARPGGGNGRPTPVVISAM